MRRLASFCLAAFAFSACSSKQDTPPAPEETAQAGTAVAPAAAEAEQEEPAFVTTLAGMRHQPTDDKKVTDPDSGKQENNWMATLYRGEQVVVLGHQGDWAKVRASDESVGWLKGDDLLSATNATLATTLEDELKTFSRPDFSALNTGRTLEAGALLFVTKVREPFSEVNYTGGRTVWVMTDRLTTDSNEIEAARLVTKARYLEAKKDPAAEEFWTLAKNNFGTTQLVQKLAPKDETQEPSAPTAPAAPQPKEAPTAAAGE